MMKVLMRLGMALAIPALVVVALFGAIGGRPGDVLPTMAVLPSVTPIMTLVLATNTPESEGVSVAAAATDDALAATRGSGLVTIIPTAIPITPTLRPGEIRAAADVTQSPDIFIIEPVTYYAEGQVNIRDCPSTDCQRMGVIQEGTALTVDAILNGEEFEEGNLVWYRVQYGGKDAYVYSGFMKAQRDTPTPVSRSGQTSTNIQRRPDNCEEARAMGLSEREAAQWDHLDRDNDGVACYGD